MLVDVAYRGVKAWAFAYFIFQQGQGYLGPVNTILLLTGLVLTGSVSRIITGYGVSTTLAVFLIVPFAFLAVFALGWFQYRFVFQHQQTASIMRTRESMTSLSQTAGTHEMAKQLLEKMGEIQAQIDEIQTEIAELKPKKG